jgi:DNA-binding IclR family transcriptional regulator
MEEVGLVESSSTRTLDRAFLILEAVAEAPGSVGVTELSAVANLDKATVSRLLASMRTLGYVRQHPEDRKYTLGGRALWLARRYQDSRAVGRIALPFLQALAETTGETVHLAIAEGSVMNFVLQVDPRNPIRLESTVGTRLPLHRAATGRAVLSTLSRKEREEMIASLTEMDPDDPALIDLESAIVAAESQGWASVNRGDDITRVAAAIRDSAGAAIAGVSVSGPSFRVESLSGEMAKACMSAARDISAALGYSEV